MRLIRKLQARLLQRDIKKGKTEKYLAETYPMTLLLDAEVFEQLTNTQLFRPKGSTEIYDIKGNYLGLYFRPGMKNESQEIESKYLVVENEGNFENSDVKTSYAIYDKNGKCVVPHNCYTNAFQAEDYVILSMPMEDRYYGKTKRVLEEGDETKVVTSTGKSLAETIGDIKNPKVLFVAHDKIVVTAYSAIIPAPVETVEMPYNNNIVWIAQKSDKEEMALKFDKRLYLIETYKLPPFAHQERNLIYKDAKTGNVYKLEVENGTPRRANLRTGQLVNLITFEKSRQTKKDREEKAQEVQPVNEETVEVTEEVKEKQDYNAEVNGVNIVEL